MSEKKQDIDKMKALIGGAKKLIAAGEKVMADNKVDWKDSQHVPEIFTGAVEFTKAVIAYREMADEAKDLDSAEIAELVKLLLGK